MLPSIGFPELLIILLLAIIVVGPKDMPKMMGKISGFLRQIRAMGEEFKGAFNDMAKDTELDELRNEINELKSLGSIKNLMGDDIEAEMRGLDTDIRSDMRGETSAAHPRVKPALDAGKPGGSDGKA